MSGRTNHLQTKGIFIDEDARRRPSSSRDWFSRENPSLTYLKSFFEYSVDFLHLQTFDSIFLFSKPLLTVFSSTYG